MAIIGSYNIEPPKSNAKKYVLIALICSVVLLVIAIVGLVIYPALQPKTMTVKVDGVNYQMQPDLFIFTDDGTVYVSLKDISAFNIGYKYYNGGYGEYTEDPDLCYMESENEISTYELGESTIYKTLKEGTIQYSSYKLNKPVMKYNEKLYVSSEMLERGCNLKFSYDAQSLTINIFTLSYYYNSYTLTAQEQYGYLGLSENFTNKKAILNGMLVVNSNERFGVVSLDNKTTYIGTKYDDLEYLEGSDEFLVTASMKKGMITKEGVLKIPVEYDTIRVLDDDATLYYVEEEKLKGVLRKNGETLIYPEYDAIGINAQTFKFNHLKNSMVLLDRCIPVQKNKKWGLFNLEGEQITAIEYDSLGFVTGVQGINSTLVLEDIEGIVVYKDKKYGIVDRNGDEILPCLFDKIYSVTENGQIVSYVEYEINKVPQKVKAQAYIDAVEAQNKKNNENANTEPSPSPSPEVSDSQETSAETGASPETPENNNESPETTTNETSENNV